MKYDSLIFDLDGTLWDSSTGIVGAWARVFKNHPEIKRSPVTEEDLGDNFGLPLETIAANLFPDFTPEKRNALMDECCEHENEYLATYGGKLYEDEMEILEKLSQKLPLFIVSNCQSGYIESYLKGNKTERFFTDHECIGDTGLSKGENISLIIERNGLKRPVYIGDTTSDEEAANQAGIPFIHAAYGFGSARDPEHVIYSLRDLWDILNG